MKEVIVLLNMGGPNNLDEVPVFLRNMFNDKRIIGAPKIIRKLIASIITWRRTPDAVHNYTLLGGASPIVAHTQALVKSLQEQSGIDVVYAMRYTPPYTYDVLSKLGDYDRIYALPLYPHYSTTTTLSSYDDLDEAARALGIKEKIVTVTSYYGDPLYNQAIVARIKEALGEGDPAKYDVVFSAHGLPQKVIDQGDLYQKHIRLNLFYARKALLEAGLVFRKTHLAYQSRLGPMAWIRPYLEDKLATLEGRHVIIYPLAFTVDNSETECELAIEYAEKAQQLGLASYTVTKAPNDHPLFVATLISLLNRCQSFKSVI